VPTAARRAGTPEPKTCAVCGRTMEWRRKWARNWDEVRYCSDACRHHGRHEVDEQLEAGIVDLLARRRSGATICPSEAAGRGPGVVHEVAPAFAAGAVEITQGGRVVDPSTAKGPIRIRRRT
jgi:hypothetical protein